MSATRRRTSAVKAGIGGVPTASELVMRALHFGLDRAAVLDLLLMTLRQTVSPASAPCAVW
jgi:hypothetical protein